MDKQILRWKMEQCLKELEKIDSETSKSQLHNEQFVLNFYDKINEISIRK